jgi:hypothetical protein
LGCFGQHGRLSAYDQVRRLSEPDEFAQVMGVEQVDRPAEGFFEESAQRGVIAPNILELAAGQPQAQGIHDHDLQRLARRPAKLHVNAAVQPGKPETQQDKGDDQNGPESFLP